MIYLTFGEVAPIKYPANCALTNCAVNLCASGASRLGGESAGARL